tara:strand:- start:463 stop:606 length:144 start_codon:yes stop_codon:yes gene_type:complete
MAVNMELLWRNFKEALALNRWPVMTPEQIKLKIQKDKLKRLYGKANH